MKPWQKNTLMGIGIPAFLAGCGLAWNFLTVAVPSHAQDESQEKRLSDVEKVAVKLGKIHEVEEAKRQQRIDDCNTSIIISCRVCRDVGIEIDECKE